MQVALDAPTRPALRYYGGKHRLAPWIISFFPPHLNYVEPCCGACSVLLQKPRSPLETVNDLDGNVVNFFRVLRDQPEELIRKIRLTPWAREEYETSKILSADPIESARRFFTKCWMGRAASDKTGWRFDRYTERQVSFDTVNSYQLEQVAFRLLGVQIEHRDSIEIINEFNCIGSLIYFDPPYVEETRTNKNQYVFEWAVEEHETAADLLRTAAGYVVVSGYACPLYADLYERHGWQRVDKEAQTNSGGKRIESLWLSPRTIEALGKPQQAGLFI